MTVETKKKKQVLNIETIKAQSGIEEEIKIVLDECPTQAVRSVPLTEWVKKLVRRSRQTHEDDEIAGWVVAYAKKGNWSDAQISFALIEAGIERFKGGYNTKYHPIDLVKTFKRIVEDLTQMEEVDLIDCDYSPERVVENAEKNLREWTSRMNEGQLRINKKLTKATIALFRRGSELMQQREQNVKKFSA